MFRIGKQGWVGATIARQAFRVLRSPGVTGHTYTPNVSNYLLSDGSTGPTTVDSVTGLVLDGVGSLGAELVTNGGFDTDTWWGKNATVTISDGVAVYTASIANTALYKTVFSTSGKTYKVEFEIVTLTEGGIRVDISNSYGLCSSQPFTTVGQHSAILLADDSTLYLSTVGASTTATIDNVSVREITGIHATQATTANKPILREGLVNQFTYSNDLSNAAWTKTNVTVSASGVLAPDGSTSFAITDDATASDHKIRQAATVATGTAVTCAVIAKAGTAGYLWVYDGYADVGRNFRLSDGGILGIAGGGAPTSSTHADLGDGWGLYTIAYTTSTSTRLDIGLSQNGVSINYIGSGQTILIESAGLFQGTWTAAQIAAEGGIPLTTTAPAISGTGPYWWEFDGVNDALDRTYPAGYESATVIKALSGGQSTLTAQNIVGSYQITASTYGQIVVKVSSSITAAQLVILQNYADHLAGI